jgi:hypothetical protein
MLDDRAKERFWAQMALALGALVLALLVLDLVVLHPGYAHGDETDIIARIQRLREGMAIGWDLGQGSIHRRLMLVFMSLWPGRLWASSAAALAGVCAEGFLLFALGRRLAGSRAGFFAVLLGLASAFTLIRARVALSYSLFTAEFLLMLWLRALATRPWQWILWGAALGLLCFDYEAWLPVSALCLAVPFMQPLPLRQRAWELLGLLCVVAALLPLDHLMQYLERRKNASLSNSGSPSAGWRGLWQLLFDAPCLPYMAPQGHGVLPFWYWLLLPFGLGRHWGRRFWAPLLYIGLGLLLPLMGGAPYGLPAHRAIAAWPALVLLGALGLEQVAIARQAQNTSLRIFLGLALAFLAGHQFWVWQEVQWSMDLNFRARVRDMKRGADVAWARSQAEGIPLVTELHPMEGAQFRFLVGHPVPMPDARSTTILAFVPWEYLPALQHRTLPVLSFQEQESSPPAVLALLSGPLGAECLEAERTFRPLALQRQQHTVGSLDLMLKWLRENPKAGPWARTLVLDSMLDSAHYVARSKADWLIALRFEPLISARPVILASNTLKRLDPKLAYQFALHAAEMDPQNGGALAAESDALKALGCPEEALVLDQAAQIKADQGLLFYN